MILMNDNGERVELVQKPDLVALPPVSKDEFKELGQKVFGHGREYGWKTYMANITGTPVSTINQWAGGKNRVPPIVGWILRTLDKLV